MTAEEARHPSRWVRPVQERPSWSTGLWRVLVVTLVTGGALLLLDRLLAGLSFRSPWHALLAGLVLGLLNSLVWPALASVVVPISVLTLGLGAIVLDVLAVALVLGHLPGVEVTGTWTPVWIVLGLALITTLLSSLLALDDDDWFDQRMAARARRLVGEARATDVPGLVMVQIDGLSRDVLLRAMRSGDAPTLLRWVREGSHRLIGWETGWSSQTGVSQCGILHGSTRDMPAFRWVEKDTGRVVVSNRPRSAALIQQRHSDGNGLLAGDGASYATLFSGDAQRSVMTMSVVARTKEGRVGAGYGRYFARPNQAVRTLLGVVAEVWRELWAAIQQERRDIVPRVPRGLSYAFLRAFTTVVSRDVCVQGVLDEVASGRSRVYVNLVGYDEVAHHSGPERADALAVLRDTDRQIRRIERSFRWAPRPYRIVVLSDHGQTQGETFAQRTGTTLAELVARLSGGAAVSGDRDAEEGRTESSAWARQVTGKEREERMSALPTVLASGGLGLVYLPGEPRRLTLEEIEERHPGLVEGLASHPEIGFVLVRSRAQGSVVLGRAGRRLLDTGEVVGEDPLEPYGPRAAEHVREVDGYANVADIMVNARFDPELEEICAFETQVGSHGALGGPQNRPFLLYPAELSEPGEVVTAVGVHRVLRRWLAELGQDVPPHPSTERDDVEALHRGEVVAGQPVVGQGPERVADDEGAQRHGAPGPR